MRKTLMAVAVVAAALTSTVTMSATASAAPTHSAAAQSPLGYWDYFGHFDTSDQCNSFGQNGVNQGTWPQYECDFDWIDWDYDLYVWIN
ncbi:hypothetical protein [Kutzneria sp. NPDC051319]|uniref:hypothetical protein n=1 Tax=Kutzneria sp. NPDC051319 TaxID=3155047 RepID=UPI00343E2714